MQKLIFRSGRTPDPPDLQNPFLTRTIVTDVQWMLHQCVDRITTEANPKNSISNPDITQDLETNGTRLNSSSVKVVKTICAEVNSGGDVPKSWYQFSIGNLHGKGMAYFGPSSSGRKTRDAEVGYSSSFTNWTTNFSIDLSDQFC